MRFGRIRRARPWGLAAAVTLAACLHLHAQATPCYGGTCQVQPSCTSGAATTVTGTVFAPNGTDPISKVLVYIPQSQPSALTPGAQCLQAGQPASGAPVTTTTSAADGTFTLTGVPTGNNIPIVIQAGKWRTQSVIPTVAPCTNTVVPPAATTFPSTQSQGDIPKIAISTGNVDSLECVLRKVGIADSEFTDPSGSGRINLYKGDVSSGAVIDSSTPSESTLESDPTVLDQYDVVIFACQGSAGNQANAAAQQNLLNYTAAGGRVFATHFSYVWLDQNSVFSAAANWVGDQSISDTSPLQATINPNFSEANILTQWLGDENGLYSATPAEVNVYETRKDVSAVNAPAESWLTLNDSAAGDPIMQFTFNTPFGAPPANQCGRVLFNDYHVENSNGSNGDIFPSECVPAITGYSVRNNVVTFNSYNSLVAGNVVTISGLTTTEGQAFNGQQFTVLSTGLSQNSFEVSANAADTSGVISDGGQVNIAMTPQEKLLEYSLFDLSTFVQPQLLDQAINFALPSPVPYGTAPLPLSATGGGSGNPVTFTVTGPASLQGNHLVLTAAGTVTVTANQAGNAVYNPAPSITQTVLVTPITPTVTGSSNPNPVSFGNPITLSVNVSSPAGTPTGSVTFYNGTTPIATVQLESGAGSTVLSSLPVGTYSFTALYSGDNNFTTASSSPIPQQVTPITPTVTGSSGPSPVFFGNPVTLSVNVSSPAGIPTGSVTFYNGATPIATVPLEGGAGSTVLSSLPVGAYSFIARYSGDSKFTTASSSPIPQTVQATPITPTVTGSSGPNPVFFGNPVTLSVNVSSPAGTPTGSVTFYNGATPIATVPLVSGAGSVALSSLPVGAYSFIARYNGNNNFTTASSSPIPQTVLDFSITPVGSTSSPVNHAGTAVFNFVVAPIGGSATPAPITFTVAGQRSGSTVVISPSSLSAQSGPTPVSLSITPLSYPTSSSNRAPRPFGSAVPYAALALLVLPFARGFRRRRRRLQQWLTVLVLVFGALGVVGLMGCGAGWPPQARGIVVTATSGSLSHTTEFSLTEQ